MNRLGALFWLVIAPLAAAAVIVPGSSLHFWPAFFYTWLSVAIAFVLIKALTWVATQ